MQPPMETIKEVTCPTSKTEPHQTIHIKLRSSLSLLSCFPPPISSSVLGLIPTADDGTGGSASLGQFKVLPQYCQYAQPYSYSDKNSLGCPLMEKERRINQKIGSVKSEPGFFGLELENGVKSQTTTTSHSVLSRFDFKQAMKLMPNTGLDVPDGKKLSKRGVQVPFQLGREQEPKGDVTILLDLTNDLDHTYQGEGSLLISISKEKVAVIKGSGKYLSSFGKQPFKIHFCSTVPGVDESSIWINDTLQTGTHLSNPPKYSQAGALLKLNKKQLEKNDGVVPIRMGISWVDQEKACDYLDEELRDWREQTDFDKIKKESRESWNQILGETFRPSLEGVEKNEVINFYSSFYRTFIAPTNVTGDNPHWESKEPIFDSVYRIWWVDSQRRKTTSFD